MTQIDSLRGIRLFVAAYEERSFTAAADRENATQSGISQHVRKIEDRFGVKLFSREAGAVRPTPAGDQFYRHCVDLLRRQEAAAQALAPFQAGLEGRISVGLIPTVTRHVLAPSLVAFVEAHPNVAVSVVEGYSPDLAQRVQAGELDFAIVPAWHGAPGLKMRLLVETPEVLVSRGGAGLKSLRPVRLADLGPLKLIVPNSRNSRRAGLQTYLGSHGVQIARLLELDAMLGTLDLVARTDWMVVLPGLMMAGDVGDGRYAINPLEPMLGTELVLVESARRALSPAAKAFLAMLEDEAARIDAVWRSDAGRGRNQRRKS